MTKGDVDQMLHELGVHHLIETHLVMEPSIFSNRCLVYWIKARMYAILTFSKLWVLARRLKIG